MSDTEQKIAKARSTFIGFEDHGFLTATVDFDYGGAGQGLGGRAFGSMNEEDGRWANGHAMGMDYIRRLLLAFGVDSWEQIRGRTVLVTCTWTEIQRIDPLPTEKGEPFDIVEWAESWKRATA
jgi:hypothetical protein